MVADSVDSRFRPPAARPTVAGDEEDPVRRIALLALVLAATAVPAGPASAGGTWASLARHGVPPESGGHPRGVGGAAHGVDAAGTLWLSVALEGAAPDALHEA